eukprot:m.13589 g.13589  ORF g.13589 m.13589 type:complete len:133 (+) comp5963_c0_seq1:550-948(+)
MSVCVTSPIRLLCDNGQLMGQRLFCVCCLMFCQVLLANMYNPYAINAEDFEVLLEYLGNLQGHSLHVTLTEARSWFEDEEKPLMEEWTTSALREYAKHNDEPISDEDKGKLLSLLRQVVQCRAQQILFQLSA